MEAYTDSLRTLGRRLNAELLLNDTEADNSMRHAQTIGDAVGRMAGMINNLLVYFRLDSGKEIHGDHLCCHHPAVPFLSHHP